jgi:hypothetical protein
MKYVAAVPHAPVLEDVILPQTEDISAKMFELLSF